jgi:hypothetical protein
VPTGVRQPIQCGDDARLNPVPATTTSRLAQASVNSTSRGRQTSRMILGRSGRQDVDDPGENHDEDGQGDHRLDRHQSFDTVSEWEGVGRAERHQVGVRQVQVVLEPWLPARRSQPLRAVWGNWKSG